MKYIFNYIRSETVLRTLSAWNVQSYLIFAFPYYSLEGGEKGKLNKYMSFQIFMGIHICIYIKLA
jgi:hypothetical protein